MANRVYHPYETDETDTASVPDVRVPPVRSATRSRRILLLLPTVFAVVAGWWVATKMDPFNTSAPSQDLPSYTDGQLRYDATANADGNDWLELFTRPKDASPLGLNPARQALDHEPAHLPAYAGPGQAEHETRFRLGDGGWVDDISFWRITDKDSLALADAVRHHYDKAAKEIGFRPLPLQQTASRSPGRTNLLYLDDQRPARSLSVQILEQTTGCHVTITLRYSSSTP